MQLEFDSMNGTFPAQTPLHYNRKRIYALGSTLELNYNNTASGPAQNWALDTVRIYVPGPDGIIGAREFRPAELVGGVPSPREKALVYHYDHLGSITAITDYGTSNLSADTGGKPGRYSEDAWGQRRNPFTWSGVPLTTGATQSDDGSFDSLTPRGFTGHEMLDDLGLVHMNGRIYDPVLGRFLSADLIVQAPMSLQSYNRYSYVLNNPLTLFDPSGFASTTPVLDAVIGTLHALAAPVVVPYRTVFDNDRLTTEIATGWQSDSAASESAGRNGTLGALNRFNPLAQIYNGVTGEDLSNDRQLNTEQRWQNGVGGLYGTALIVAPALGKGPVATPAATAEAAASVTTETSSRLTTTPVPAVVSAAPDVVQVNPSTAAPVTATADALTSRAQAVHSALDPVAQNMRTTAALGTDQGTTIIGGGARDLTPAQRAALQPGEVAARLPGQHAEVTVLTAARASGQSPQALSVTRDICAHCQAAIESSGGTVNTPRTATWPQRIPPLPEE